MYEFSIRLRTVTPMFMTGASGEPEVRPSEFKGMMRWWWRATRVEDDISKLKREEEELFGGAGDEQGKSRVWLRGIKGFGKVAQGYRGNDLRGDYFLKWGFDRSSQRLSGKHAGLGYLFFSVLAKSYVKDGYEFSLKLLAGDRNETAFKQGLASLWLAIYLGGFGQRSRRGGGNLEVVEKPILKTPNNEGYILGLPEFYLVPNIDTKEKLRNFLDSNIRKAINLIGQSKGTRKYTGLKDAELLIFEPKPSWYEALNFLGSKYEEYRYKKRKDIVRTTGFGMPVRHSRTARVNLVPQKYKARLASPIVFKVIKSTGSNRFNEQVRYFPVVIKLCPGYYGKVVDRKGRPIFLPGEGSVKSFNISYGLLNEFLSDLKKIPNVAFTV